MWPPGASLLPSSYLMATISLTWGPGCSSVCSPKDCIASVGVLAGHRHSMLPRRVQCTVRMGSCVFVGVVLTTAVELLASVLSVWLQQCFSPVHLALCR